MKKGNFNNKPELKEVSHPKLKTKIIPLIFWYWRLYWQTVRGAGIYYLFARLYREMAPWGQSFFLARFLDVLVQTIQTRGSWSDFWLQSEKIWFFYFIFLIGEIIFSFDGWFVDNLLITRPLRWLFREKILQVFTRLDYAQIEDAQNQELFRKTFNQGAWPLTGVTTDLSLLLIDTISFLIYLTSFWALHLPLVYSFPLIFFTLLHSLIGLKQNQIGFRLYEKFNRYQTLLWRIYDFFTQFYIILEAKLSRADNYLYQRYRRLSKNILQAEKKAYLPWSLLSWLINSCSQLSLLGIVFYLFQQTLRQTLSLGQLTFAINVSEGFRRRLGTMLWRYNELENTFRYSRYFYAFNQLQPQMHDGGKRLQLQEPPLIVCENVFFRYPRQKKWALKKINLAIPPGAKLAIVGENGAGKTTLLKLLLRLYDPQQGQIFLNGRPLSQYRLEDLWQVLRLIPQDFARYRVLTARENIAMSDWQHREDRARIWAAAKAAAAERFLKELPQKLETPLSNEFEEGVELSTGQWQKIALARLFFHPGQVLLLDEPTASIDPLAEFQIFQNIYRRTHNKTVIIISHRYRTVRDAEKIIVLQEGEICEQGSHEELLAAGGVYARAWEAQEKPKLPL